MSQIEDRLHALGLVCRAWTEGWAMRLSANGGIGHQRTKGSRRGIAFACATASAMRCYARYAQKGII